MMRAGLFAEVVAMAFETVRTNALRSVLTVLGVVIGVSSIVGMTAMVRGFDDSLRDSIRAIGPNTIFIQRFGHMSFASRAQFAELIRRPNLSISDARAIEEQAQTIDLVDIQIGAGGFGRPTQERVFYRDLRTRPLVVLGTTEHFALGTDLGLVTGRFFTGTEVQHRKKVVVLGQTAYQALFAPRGTDPIGKLVRVGSVRYTVLGAFESRPEVGGFNAGQDDFVVVPHTAYQRQFGVGSFTIRRGGTSSLVVPIQIAVVPREGVSQPVAIRDVQRVMRIRHGLKLNEPDDFDIVTQDAILELWDQISEATFLALIVISSIALMVGGIGVMAIMSISVTERTREIGVRMALGARRGEILFQFLTEAVVLTSLGGVLGIVLGSGLGYGMHLASGFPIALPWWSFATGLGFSASVGIFFGIYPAFRASRLDPIEALRYE